ncbi:uncharacterized protein LAESUDRAFT_763726 [Laetiporus sulphureus 93-53]|uniref:Uncharacterized protein n=1 Tax=Laetiporus sulphureus 93-53 TaxID=1314785 RepID=A0A165BQI5_9APHY|nr:uncharacterized protein LAESUDRAFT_763726 [Laetiporus sulphureus 93-53]KZT01470.1 hypothetical protein LAESUDRAFT_763726 [Laetiporus sulphureus 93-53]
MSSARMFREIYMNIPNMRGPKEESFEERRVADYIKAYTTTGKPPAPCPTVPTDPARRATMGLPPLFEPYSEVVSSSDSGMTSGSAATSANVSISALPSSSGIPDVQVWHPVRISGDALGGVFQSIAAQPEFSSFSFEELRLKAYRKGLKFANVSQPSAVAPSTSNAPQRLTNGADAEKLQNISCNPRFDKHSAEELRLAFLRSGRELTSHEIIQQSRTLGLS